MSEYQYYEFLALDQPLTDEQRAQLRQLSSRAEITATSFVNEYSYGDFRGDPVKLMERYFDAFYYVANWGTRQLMFRFPRTLLDEETARKYCHTDVASVIVTDAHVIINLYLDYESDDWVDGYGQLETMVQARSDLAAGDLRLLYLAWLLSVQWGYDDEYYDDEIEPPVPADFGKLSAPLQAIAEFFDIGEDLIAVAAKSSSGRTVGELLDAAEARRVQRENAEEQRRHAARNKELDDLAAMGEAAWKRVDDMIATKVTSEYDQAVVLLGELRALAEREGEDETVAFKKRVLDLRAEYSKRPGLQYRLDRAGL